MDMAKADRTIDVQGQICPYPAIEIKLALKRLAEGQALEVLTDYEPTVRTTVPALCERAGYPFEVTEIRRNAWRVLIRKGRRSNREECCAQCKS